MKQNLIQIAFSTSSHGIKGEFSVKLINEDSRTLKNGMIIYLKKNDQFIANEIESIRYGNKTILKLKGIEERNQSDSLVPFEIYVDKNELPDLDEDEFYMFDLIGLNVFDQEDNLIGKLIDFYDSPTATIVQVKTENKILEVVFNDHFIKEVDLENNKIVIVVPEYIE
jgi:16S rRNA processing protein RimM